MKDTWKDWRERENGLRKLAIHLIEGIYKYVASDRHFIYEDNEIIAKEVSRLRGREEPGEWIENSEETNNNENIVK